MSTPADAAREAARRPAGSGAGGQFGTQERAEAEGVGLDGPSVCSFCGDPSQAGAQFCGPCQWEVDDHIGGNHGRHEQCPMCNGVEVDMDGDTLPGDYDPETGESFLDVYGNTDECVAIGAHLTACDDDGYCVHCGDQTPLDEDDDMEPDDYAAEADQTERLLEFQVPGSSSNFEVRVLDDGDGPPEFELWRDGAYIGDLDSPGEAFTLDEVRAVAERKAAAMLAAAGGPSAPTDRIANPEWKAACEEYTTRYAPAPVSFDYEPDWAKANQRQKSARDLTVGDRLVTNQVVTHLSARNGEVYAWCDGADPQGKADAIFNHGDPVICHADRVDLSDPDWFEVEAARAVPERISYAEDMTNDEDYVMPDTEREAMRARIRHGMYQSYSGSDISPLHPDGDRYDPRTPNGRAKVGDDVYTSSPMHGDTAYRVIGKMPHRTILGADDDGVHWGETGEVEYVIENVATGHQETSNLRGVSWRRIPAPGDNGPGAQVQAVGRRRP